MSADNVQPYVSGSGDAPVSIEEPRKPHRFKYILLLALLVIAAGLWAYANYYAEPEVVSMKFVGQVQDWDDDTIVVRGNYLVEDDHDLTGQQEKIDVQVEIDAQTKFARTAIRLPTSAELQASGGVYNADDLPREASDGSMADMDNDLTVTVLTAKNSYGKTSITASELQYTIPIYPD